MCGSMKAAQCFRAFFAASGVVPVLAPTVNERSKAIDSTGPLLYLGIAV